MDPNQYPYASQPPPYQLYPPAQQLHNRSSQTFSTDYNTSGQRVSYVQPQYVVKPPEPPVAELPATFESFVAELPPALPSAPPTTTSPQQLNEDELLAHKLQNLEVEEARRRSSSNLSLRPSQPSLRDVATLTPRASQSQLATSAPQLPPRPHSESFSSLPFYGPDSFGPPPNPLETNDGRMLMAGMNEYGNQPPPTPQTQSLPEVIIGAHPVSSSGFDYAPTMSNTSFATPPVSAPMDAISLASYLETHREVPYPPQWVLPPVINTLYASIVRAPKATDWLDLPLSREWRNVRASQHAVTPAEPTYTFAFKSKGGSLRDPRYSWTMTPSQWTYNLKIDSSTGMRKSELLTTPQGIDLITTYLQAQNYDSLRFIGPDRRVYLWVAHAPLSSVSGARYDTLRHALFMAPKGQDPLYGKIVADHAYWDGFIDYSEVHRVACAGCGASPINGLRWTCKSCANHDICEQCRLANNSIKTTCSFTLVNLPDEALYIRSPHVDPALVCATLQIMRDWEFQMLRAQKNRDPKGFKMSEDIAREGDLGRLAYWRSGEDSGQSTKVAKPQEKEIDPRKAAKLEKAKAKEQEKLSKAKEKERASKKVKGKEKDERGSVVGISELIRGSAHVGGAVGDVGEALRRKSTSS